MVPQFVAKNLGKLFRNIKDPQWLAAGAAETAMSMLVLNPAGRAVYSYLHVHLFDGDEKVGAVFKCSDGHYYVKTSSGAKHRLNTETNEWHIA